MICKTCVLCWSSGLWDRPPQLMALKTSKESHQNQKPVTCVDIFGVVSEPVIDGILQNWRKPETLCPAWLLRWWGRGAAKKLCAELTRGVGCSCGNFHWRSVLLRVDSELGALPSTPCQPGVTRANKVLPALFSSAKQSWFELVCLLCSRWNRLPMVNSTAPF